MSRTVLKLSFLTLFTVLFIFKPLLAAGKPDVIRHEANFLESAVNIHVEWQSDNPVSVVNISLANMQKEIKVDPYDNKRNRDGYAGEVTVTLRLDSFPNRPLTYVIQLEDELRMKSALVTGKVKIPQPQQPQYPQPQYPQQPGMIIQPQQPSMQIQIQPGLPQPTYQIPQQPGTQTFPQPGIQPGVQSGGQQVGTIILIIVPQIVADSGAMWRVGNSPWKRSGEAIPNLPVGFHTIEFQNVGGWNKPENLNVVIEGGQTLTLNGIYNNK